MIPYDATATKDLEDTRNKITKATTSNQATEETGEVSITAVGRAYTIDVMAMEQRNNSTGIIRKVRRIAPTEDEKSQSNVLSQ